MSKRIELHPFAWLLSYGGGEEGCTQRAKMSKRGALLPFDWLLTHLKLARLRQASYCKCEVGLGLVSIGLNSEIMEKTILLQTEKYIRTSVPSIRERCSSG